MKNLFLTAWVVGGLITLTNGAWAQSNDAILRRLDALEQSNAKLANENAALRERVRRVEGRKQNLALAPTTAPTAMTANASVYKALPPIAAPLSWTGFYIGAHFGGGWGTNTFLNLQTATTTNPGAELGSGPANGILGGGQIGYNYQFGRALVGIEGEYSASNVKGDTHLKAGQSGTAHHAVWVQNRGIATVTGKVGAVFQDNMLLYGKGGYAWTRNSYDLTEWQSGFIASVPTVNDNRSGYVVGFGTEYMFDGNWSAKIEYNYMDFGTKTVNFSQAVSGTVIIGPGSADVLNQLHTVKVGVNYLFGNYGKGPVVTRY